MQQEKLLVIVVIPLLNEENVIDATLREVSHVLDGITEAYEIIVVDDGSGDGTFAALEKAHQANPRVLSK